MNATTRSMGAFLCAFASALVFLASPWSSAQVRVPRLEPAECPFERGDWARDVKCECKWLVVPEAREKQSSRTIKLAVVVLRAREAGALPPLVFLHGGPGGSGIRSFTQGAAAAGLDRRRDVVIYDQRGAGFSEPALCPAYGTQEAIEKTAARQCIASLDARIDRSAYNTGASAADLIDLRHTLGYAAWDVFGESYGGRLAQEAMRRDAAGIHAVVLDKPSTRGPAREAEVAASNQRAFDRVFADCREQPECRAAFPSLTSDFDEIFDELNKAPLSVPLDQNPNETSVVLDGKRVVDRIRDDIFGNGAPARLAQLPLLIHEFRHGDRMRAARTLVTYNLNATSTGDSALISLVGCFDVYGRQLRNTREEINTQVRAPFRRDLMEDCELWQAHFADPSEWEPVRGDMPVLILTGRYDDRIPTEHAKRIASTLTHAHVYEFPNEAHGKPTTACHRQIVQQFLADPFRDLDVTCIQTIPPIQFLTRWPGPVDNGRRSEPKLP